MRRTLALAGAAVLAVGITGLAGPAAADPGTTSHEPVVFNEVGVDLVNAGPSISIDGSFLEIRNNSGSSLNIGAFRVVGCDAANLFQIALIPDNTILVDDQTYLLADNVYNSAGGPLRDQAFDTGADLDQADGGVLLMDASGVEQHSVKWGGPSSTTCAAFDPAGSTPTNTQTLNYDSDLHTWSLGTATPQPM